MRHALAALVVLGACSHRSGWPAYSEAVTKQLAGLASECTAKSGPPNGYDSIVDCHPSGDFAQASVSVMLMDNRIGQLEIDITEPSIDAALARIEPAVAGVVDHATFEQIAQHVRRGKPAERVGAIAAPSVYAGAEQRSPNGPWQVSVSFDWRTE